MKTLEEKKQDLAYKAILRNITTMTPDEHKFLQDGLNKIPIMKVIDYCQQVENNLLPQIVKKHGIKSEHYRLFKGIVDSLNWGLHIESLVDRLSYQYSNEKLLCEFYRERCLFLEGELQKYTTLEALYHDESLQWAAKIISKKHRKANETTNT